MKWSEIDPELRKHAAMAKGYQVFPYKGGFYGEGDRVVTEQEAWDQLFRRICLTGRIYRHKKGGIYMTVGVAKNTGTGEEVMVYDHLAPHEKGTWVRGLDEFNEPGRFERVEAGYE